MDISTRTETFVKIWMEEFKFSTALHQRTEAWRGQRSRVTYTTAKGWKQLEHQGQGHWLPVGDSVDLCRH